MNVYLEPPAFGLPSADAESIAVLSYCSLVAPDSFRADYSASADRLVTGFLPTLHDASTDAWVAGFDDIVTYLRQQGLDTDDHLSTGARAEIVAYSSLVERKARDLTVSLQNSFGATMVSSGKGGTTKGAMFDLDSSFSPYLEMGTISHDM